MRKQSKCMVARGGHRVAGDRTSFPAQVGHSLCNDKSFHLHANALMRKLTQRAIAQTKEYMRNAYV